MNGLRDTSPVANDDIPHNPKERQVWFDQKYRELIDVHIANLRVYFPHLQEEESIVFYEITENGEIHVIYGKLHLYVPTILVRNATDWRNTFDVEIGGNKVPIESRIEAAQRDVNRKVETTRLRGMQQLTPPRVKSVPVSSQSTIFQKVARIVPKSK